MISNTREAFQAAVNPQQSDLAISNSREWFKKITFSTVGQAIIGTFIVVLFLYVFNPPMVQSKSESDIEHPTRNLKKVMIWGAITGVLILSLPYAIRHLQKKQT